MSNSGEDVHICGGNSVTYDFIKSHSQILFQTIDKCPGISKDLRKICSISNQVFK